MSTTKSYKPLTHGMANKGSCSVQGVVARFNICVT